MTEQQKIPEPTREYHFIIWVGDGSIAGYKHDYLDLKTGKRKFFFKPTEDMRYKNQIQEFEYNEFGFVEKEYDDILCLNMTTSAKSIKWFLFCDYKGNSIIERINSELAIKLRNALDENKALKMALIVAQQGFLDRETFRKEFDKDRVEELKNIKDIFRFDLNPST